MAVETWGMASQSCRRLLACGTLKTLMFPCGKDATRRSARCRFASMVTSRTSRGAAARQVVSVSRSSGPSPSRQGMMMVTSLVP